MNPIYVNFGIPQQAVSQVGVGRKLHVTSEDLPGKAFAGRVTARRFGRERGDSQYSGAGYPRRIPDGKLRPGMFVAGRVRSGASRHVIPCPRRPLTTRLTEIPFIVVTDLKDPKGKSYRGVRQQFVKVEGSRGDQVGDRFRGSILAMKLSRSGVFKLRNGAAVQVNNKVQPETIRSQARG